jgi:hypothetical protein
MSSAHDTDEPERLVEILRLQKQLAMTLERARDITAQMNALIEASRERHEKSKREGESRRP